MTKQKEGKKKLISIPLYVELHESGMFDKDIAGKFGVKPAWLANWKQRNKKAIEAEITKKRSEVVAKSEYEKLLQENEKLKKQIEEITPPFAPASVNYEKRYNELSKDYEKLVHEAEETEEKVKQLEVENGILRGDIRELKIQLDNTINSCDEYFRQRNELEKELILLRELVAIHLQREGVSV